MTAEEVTLQFNAAINSRDLDALVGLMTEDHRFVDSGGKRTDGRARMRDAWAIFFASFPDYRNVFETVHVRGNVVHVLGRSSCSAAELAGPAIWTAVVRDSLIAEWRVEEDTSTNRRRLDLPAIGTAP